MLVRERMSCPVISIHPDVSIQEAHRVMRLDHIRRLPVVDSHGMLVGLVSESDIFRASPSDVTSLSIWEATYLLNKITVSHIMSRRVISVQEDTPIEEAARIMADNKIGGLPVIRQDRIVGIITETDLFKIFLELMGAREPGVRLSAQVPNLSGELVRITQAICDIGGNIVAIGTFLGTDVGNREVTIKVSDVGIEELETAIQPFVNHITDVRETVFA
jgi:acetoin utilization protein AcuB